MTVKSEIKGPLLVFLFLISVCTRATSRSWFPLWSWRAMRLCGLQQSASTKCASPSARIQSWRCAPRAWVHRQKHCGLVCLFRCRLVSLGKQLQHFLPQNLRVFFNYSFSLWCRCHSAVIIETKLEYSGVKHFTPLYLCADYCFYKSCLWFNESI